MSEEEKIWLAERFILNQMTEQERMSFLVQKQEDEDLARLVEELNLHIKAISNVGREELKKKIKGWENQVSSIEKIHSVKMRNINLPYLLGLAATVVLIIVSFVVIRSIMTMSNEDLFAAYYEPYPDVTSTVERGFSSTATPLQLALSAYANYDFDSAIIHFENIVFEENEPIVKFYLANCYLAVGEAYKALDVFSRMKSENILPALNQQIEWYLGLSYLKLGDSENAIVVFQQLAKEESVNGRKARKLVKKIQR